MAIDTTKEMTEKKIEYDRQSATIDKINKTISATKQEMNTTAESLHIARKKENERLETIELTQNTTTDAFGNTQKMGSERFALIEKIESPQEQDHSKIR